MKEYPQSPQRHYGLSFLTTALIRRLCESSKSSIASAMIQPPTDQCVKRVKCLCRTATPTSYFLEVKGEGSQRYKRMMLV